MKKKKRWDQLLNERNTSTSRGWVISGSSVLAFQREKLRILKEFVFKSLLLVSQKNRQHCTIEITNTQHDAFRSPNGLDI